MYLISSIEKGKKSCLLEINFVIDLDYNCRLNIAEIFHWVLLYIQGCHRRLKGDYFQLKAIMATFLTKNSWKSNYFYTKATIGRLFFFCISRSFDLKNTGKSCRKIISLICEKTNYFPDITRVLTIFAKYLYTYEINHSIKGSSAKN